jgi:hypothetical protein
MAGTGLGIGRNGVGKVNSQQSRKRSYMRSTRSGDSDRTVNNSQATWKKGFKTCQLSANRVFNWWVYDAGPVSSWYMSAFAAPDAHFHVRVGDGVVSLHFDRTNLSYNVEPPYRPVGCWWWCWWQLYTPAVCDHRGDIGRVNSFEGFDIIAWRVPW